MTPDPAKKGLPDALSRLRDLLDGIGNGRAADVARLLDLLGSDPDTVWRELNGNAWWAGAGSLAAETLADNPGLPEEQWRSEIRALREILIEIGETLMARGGENPGISSWVLAFRNWNASGV